MTLSNVHRGMPAFVSLVILELLAFNAQNLRGHVTLATPDVRTFFQGAPRDFPGSMRAKFEVASLDIFELLAFNAQKFKGSRDPGHTLFSNSFSGVIKL